MTQEQNVKLATEFQRMQDEIATLRAERNAWRKAFREIGAAIAVDPCLCEGGQIPCRIPCPRERLVKRFLGLRVT